MYLHEHFVIVGRSSSVRIRSVYVVFMEGGTSKHIVKLRLSVMHSCDLSHSISIRIRSSRYADFTEIGVVWISLG